MLSRICVSINVAVVLLPVQIAGSEDWNQFRGPNRNGISSETAWTCKWPAGGPKKLWSLDLGPCYASTIVVGSRVYAAGSSEKADILYCLDAMTGHELWRFTADHAPRKFPPDPRPDASPSTPLVANGRVYALLRTGQFACLDAGSGKRIWSVNVVTATGTTLPQFGLSSSPVAHKNLLLLNLGQGGAAFDRETGKVVWKTPGVGGYASPVIYSRKGVEEVAFFTGPSIVGADPATGQERWRYSWKSTAYGAPSADPIPYHDMLFACSSMEGSRMIRLDGAKPTDNWANRNMSVDFTNLILIGKYLYGNNRNKLACVNIETGQAMWEEKGLGQGSLSAAGGKLLVLTERGDLLVAEASPVKYVELARAKVLDGNGFFDSAGYIPPTLASGRLYCRSTKGTLICFDVRK